MPASWASRLGRRRVFAALMLTGVVVAAACAPAVDRPAVPGAAPPSATTPDSTVVPMSLVWGPLRALKWTDFQGTPDITSDASAITAYVIQYEAECTGDVLTFRAVSAFLPERSWVKTSLLARPVEADLALQHEQTHFDLSEVHVRKARRLLRELQQPCRNSTEQFDALVAPILEEDAETQRRYDRETSHGRDLQAQARWDRDVRDQLAALRAFAR